jgi:hypothetical protein
MLNFLLEALVEYPEKTCSVDRLVRQPKFMAAAIAGEKTQQRRDGVYAYPGEEFSLQGVAFMVTKLERECLGEMTEFDARAEGFPSLVAYKDFILKMHKGMEWDKSHPVWVHHFSRVD